MLVRYAVIITQTREEQEDPSTLCGILETNVGPESRNIMENLLECVFGEWCCFHLNTKRKSDSSSTVGAHAMQNIPFMEETVKPTIGQADKHCISNYERLFQRKNILLEL